MELEQPHTIGYFLVLRLKIAVTNGDEEAALDLEQEIHKRGRSEYTFRTLPTELKDPDAQLDNTIEISRIAFALAPQRMTSGTRPLPLCCLSSFMIDTHKHTGYRIFRMHSISEC